MGKIKPSKKNVNSQKESLKKREFSGITDEEFKTIQETRDRKNPLSLMNQLLELLLNLKRHVRGANRKEIKRKLRELGELISQKVEKFGTLSAVEDFQTRLKRIESLVSQGKVDEALEIYKSLASSLLEIQKEISKLLLQKSYWKQEIKKFYEENPQAALGLIKAIPDHFFQEKTLNAIFHSSIKQLILNQSIISILRNEYCLTDDPYLFREILAINPEVLQTDDLYVSVLVSKIWVATRDNNKKDRDGASTWLRKAFTKFQRKRRYYSVYEIYTLFTAFRIYFAELITSFKELKKQYNNPSILREEFAKKHPELVTREILLSNDDAETFPVSFKHKNTKNKSRKHTPEPGYLASEYTATVLKITESQVDRSVGRK